MTAAKSLIAGLSLVLLEMLSGHPRLAHAGAINLDQVARPEILDPDRIEENRIFTNLDSRSGV